MNYQFIDEIRLALEGSNIFMYTIKGAKICAILLLFFAILERWGKNTMNTSNGLNDLLTIIGYVFLIMSSDYIFNTVESTFASISTSMGSVDDSLYANLLSSINDDYLMQIEGASGAMDMASAVLGNLAFFIGYVIVLLLAGICKIAEMSMVCGYLLTRVFFLEIMKFLFPIAVALSTLKQTSGLIAKWLKLYIGLSLLGIIYIGIIKVCDLTQVALHSSFKLGFTSNEFIGYLNMNGSVWGALITIIIVFTLKVTLFNKATSFVISFFN